MNKLIKTAILIIATALITFTLTTKGEQTMQVSNTQTQTMLEKVTTFRDTTFAESDLKKFIVENNYTYDRKFENIIVTTNAESIVLTLNDGVNINNLQIVSISYYQQW